MSNEKDRTLWVGNLSNEVTEELLHELFVQAGPLERVKKVSSYSFITYDHEVSVPYALELFQGISLFNRQLNIKAKGQSAANQQEQYMKRNHSNSRENDFPNKHMRFNDDNHMRPPPLPNIYPQHSYEDLLRLGDQMSIYNNANNGNYHQHHGASTSINLEDYDRSYDNRRPRHDHNRHRDDNRRNFNRRDHGRKDYHNNRNNGNVYRRH
ncbi:unnamed protein product [Ceutorhynchus assimilis]|uniref:RRM domain-containing protein n=1 Tax=Ceutorhynchus assimilis TaxID=467358 RepID=A0A9N9QJE2_9CUCU|nr:unnamed protein product [Ceutorhynchus assimilis]